MRTAAFALALALVLALPLSGRAAPLNGEAKYGGPTDIGGDRRRESGTMNYGGPRDTSSVNHHVNGYEGSSYDSGYVRGQPRKIGRSIGPLPPGQQNATAQPEYYPPAPQGPRKIGRAIGPLPPGQQNATAAPEYHPPAPQGPRRVTRSLGPQPPEQAQPQ